VQPVQLSLLPETSPAPPTTLTPTLFPPDVLTTQVVIPPLPAEPLAEAVGLLGRLIAQTAQHATAGDREAGDE